MPDTWHRLFCRFPKHLLPSLQGGCQAQECLTYALRHLPEAPSLPAFTKNLLSRAKVALVLSPLGD